MWRSFIVFLAKTHTLNSTYISFMFVPKLVSANVCWEELIFERLLIATSGFVDWPVFQRLNNHPWVRYVKCFLTTPRWLHWRRKWQPTPVFLPGKPHGQRSLAGYSPWRSQRVGHNWSDLAQRTSVLISTLNMQFQVKLQQWKWTFLSWSSSGNAPRVFPISMMYSNIFYHVKR